MREYLYKYGVLIWIIFYLFLAWMCGDFILGVKMVLLFSFAIYIDKKLTKHGNK